MQSAVSCLLQKAHIYETLASLQNCVDQVVELTPAGEHYWNAPVNPPPTIMEQDEAPPTTMAGDQSDEVGMADKLDDVMEVEPLVKKDVPVLPNELIIKIVELLRDLNQSFNKMDSLTLLPVKVFPGVCVPEQTTQEVFMGVARMSKRRRLLESLLVLLTAPSILDIPTVFGRVRDILLTLLSTQNGNTTRLVHVHVMNFIIIIKIQNYGCC